MKYYYITFRNFVNVLNAFITACMPTQAVVRAICTTYKLIRSSVTSP